MGIMWVSTYLERSNKIEIEKIPKKITFLSNSSAIIGPRMPDKIANVFEIPTMIPE